MPHRPVNFETLLRTPYVDPDNGFDISPDGRRAAFSWNQSGQWEIYEIELSANSLPEQITDGEGSKFAPRYAPDGERLAYVLDADGGENFDAWLFDREHGKHTNLTPDTPFALQPNLSWSPDGKELAIISNRDGYFHTYIIGMSEGNWRKVLDLPNPDWDVRWSPDGSKLAVNAEGQGQDYWTYLVSPQGGEPILLGRPNRPQDSRYVRWSPDGSRMVFCGARGGFYQLGIYDLESEKIEWITKDPSDCSEPCWSPDGGKIAYIQTQGEETRLAWIDLNDLAVQRYQVEPGIHYAPRFTPDGENLLFIFDNPRQPDDLWQLRLADGDKRRLTSSLPDELKDAPFVMPEVIRYPSMDGQPVPALLFQPSAGEAGAGLRPAVIIIHGGPNWLFQLTWYPIMQYMVSLGWIVLAPNYRGSTGYGRDWQIANRFDLGGVDTQDVVAGADFLVASGKVDPQRIGITGRSHGGYLTMTCMTDYADRWAVGSAVVPFLNWFTAHKNSRQDLQHWDIENFGDPQENAERWRERSPYFFLERIQAAVQLICGENDPRCPASESISARDRLIELGKEVDFVLYRGEGHSFHKIKNVVDSELRRVDFLAKKLNK